jgi:DNA-binding HxlR family transcriptional regulator
MPKPNHSPIEQLLSQLAGQWTLYILWALFTNNILRFGELKRTVPGISTKMLTERLRMLESITLIYRNYKPTVPPEVSYELTDRGRELFTVLNRFYELTDSWYGSAEAIVDSPPE